MPLCHANLRNKLINFLIYVTSLAGNLLPGINAILFPFSVELWKKKLLFFVTIEQSRGGDIRAEASSRDNDSGCSRVRRN